MNTWHTRCGASKKFGAAILAGGISIVPGDAQECGSAEEISTDVIEGGSFDPEAIELMQAVLDEAWASFLPTRRARTSRDIVAGRVLDLVARGERDRARLCAAVTQSAFT